MKRSKLDRDENDEVLIKFLGFSIIKYDTNNLLYDFINTVVNLIMFQLTTSLLLAIWHAI